MMEFTCDGLVRWGFGFYNPNHAAAAICAMLPFTWGWRRCRWGGWLLTGGLFAMLALTYSRTGFVVAALEAVAWAGLGRAGARPSRRVLFVCWGCLLSLPWQGVWQGGSLRMPPR